MRCNASRLFLMTVIAACSLFPAQGFTADAPQATIAVFPIKSTGISENDAALIADALRMKLSLKERFDVIDKSRTAQALKDANVDTGGDCIGLDCAVSAGEKAQTDYVVSASLGKIGFLFTFNVSLFNVHEKTRLLLREYEYRGSIEDFYTDVPRRVADDIFGMVFQEAQPREIAKPVSEPAVIEETAEPVVAEPPIDSEAVKREDSATNIAIVSGPTIGLAGRAAIGKLDSDQSRWGAEIFYLHPTSNKSHIRVKFAAPLSGSDTLYRDSQRKIPDLYLSVEHEWGTKYFGIGAGLAVMYMQAMTKNLYSRQIWDSYQGRYVTDYVETAHFSEHYCYNWVLNLRGGKPTGGFRGRLSWPMPVNQSGTWPENAFLEYSALGVFGNNLCKGGIGISGMYKNRSTSEISGAIGGSSYTSSTDFYVIAPAGKLAFRLGNHNVVCATVDLIGLLIPRPDNQTWWAPNVQLNYTFSFKPLKGPDVLDGMF
jgi:hypothetical protein